MADKEHLKIFYQGSKAWNQWRKRNPDVVPNLTNLKSVLRKSDLRGMRLNRSNLSNSNLGDVDLRGSALNGARFSCADLIGADLNEADLSEANFEDAVLTGANLTGANLTRARLKGADLHHAQLLGANLGRAVLTLANLTSANLSRANLFRAELECARFVSSKLVSADFSEATLGGTIFGDADLSEAKGLDSCFHAFSSILDLSTLQKSGRLPEVFLRGCGLPESFITYLPSILSQPIQFYSCFISYSHEDKLFARRLHDALQGRGIRCWLDEHQLLPGDHMHRAVDEGIRLWDKVLLCCSRHSLHSWWVDKELQKALMKEERLSKERGQEIHAIIPLDLDGFMFDPKWDDWKQQHVASRLAANFQGWQQSNDKFVAEFEKVVKALRTGPSSRPAPPPPKL